MRRCTSQCLLGATRSIPKRIYGTWEKAGGNKPDQGFWTSTAHQRDGGKTWASDWLTGYLHDNASEWIPENGFLFEVIGTPRIFDITYADRFFDWAEQYEKIDIADNARSYGRQLTMRLHFPWDELAKHFDGAHFDGGGGGSEEFTYGWDVESTVWFDMQHLKYKGAVKLWAGEDNND